MKKYPWWQSWPRFLLWTHVIGVIAFYLILWKRTVPSKNDRVSLQPTSPRGDRDPDHHTRSDHPLWWSESLRGGNDPLVSIIVPARNEERNIRRCIESLLGQDYANFEIIAVDDASTDGTGRILAEIAAH